MDGIIVFCAKYLLVLSVLIAAWVWFNLPLPQKKKMLATAILAGAIALVGAKIASKLYYDPRPFVKSSVKPLFEHAADNGFPSDHSWFTMTAAAVIYFYSRKFGWVAAAVSLVVGISRVLAHVHSPIDIIGGFAIGIVAGAVAQFLIEKYWPKPKSTPSASPTNIGK